MNGPVDYYEVLGISKFSSEDKIKKAYRRLILQYHPDKSKCDGNKIYIINEAYDTLKDPIKKKKYDQSLKPEPHEQVNLILLFLKVFYFLTLQSFMKLNMASQSQTTQPKSNIDITITVTLEDLYMNNVKKLVINRIRKGTNEKKIVYISLCNYQDTCVFKNEGDELSEGVYGDIVVRVLVQEHPTFHITKEVNRYDIWMEEHVSLYEYYYGKSMTITHLDGEKFHVDVRGLKLNRNMIHKVKGLGISYFDVNSNELTSGDLYISFKLIL